MNDRPAEAMLTAFIRHVSNNDVGNVASLAGACRHFGLRQIGDLTETHIYEKVVEWLFTPGQHELITGSVLGGLVCPLELDPITGPVNGGLVGALKRVLVETQTAVTYDVVVRLTNTIRRRGPNSGYMFTNTAYFSQEDGTQTMATSCSPAYGFRGDRNKMLKQGRKILAQDEAPAEPDECVIKLTLTPGQTVDITFDSMLWRCNSAPDTKLLREIFSPSTQTSYEKIEAARHNLEKQIKSGIKAKAKTLIVSAAAEIPLPAIGVGVALGTDAINVFRDSVKCARLHDSDDLITTFDANGSPSHNSCTLIVTRPLFGDAIIDVQATQVLPNRPRVLEFVDNSNDVHVPVRWRLGH